MSDYRDNESGKAKKFKGLTRIPRLGVKELPDGSFKYSKTSSFKDFSFSLLIFAVAVLIIVIIAMQSKSAESIVPAAVSVIMIIGFVFYARWKRGIKNTVVVTNNSIKVIAGGEKEYSLSQYVRLECKHVYRRRRRHYIGNKYTMVFIGEDGTEVRHGFSSYDAHTASDFDYRVRKLRGETPASNGTLSTRVFAWPEKLVASNKFSSKWVYYTPFALIMLVIMGSLIGVNKDRMLEEVLPALVFLGIALVVVTILVFFDKSFVTMQFPESMSFEVGGIRVNNKLIRANDIKRVYMTDIGVGNPRELNRSTLFIDTSEGEYCLLVGGFLGDSSMLSILNNQVPNWDYSEFYYCFQQWCLENNVEFLNYLT